MKIKHAQINWHLFPQMYSASARDSRKPSSQLKIANVSPKQPNGLRAEIGTIWGMETSLPHHFKAGRNSTFSSSRSTGLYWNSGIILHSGPAPQPSKPQGGVDGPKPLIFMRDAAKMPAHIESTSYLLILQLCPVSHHTRAFQDEEPQALTSSASILSYTLSFLKKDFLNVYASYVCVSVYSCVCTHVCKYPWRTGEGVRSLERELQTVTSHPVWISYIYIEVYT